MHNPLRRRRRPVVDDLTGHHLLHDDHRHFVHPADHLLPQGVVNRGDELVWVATQIERHAEAGTLDEGNPHILDGEVASRHGQWDLAVEQEADNRLRTAKSLHAAESEHLVRLRERLGRARTSRAHARVEDDHWRAVLHGGPVSPPPTCADVARANDTRHPASAGLDLADTVAAAGAAPWRRPHPAQPVELHVAGADTSAPDTSA